MANEPTFSFASEGCNKSNSGNGRVSIGLDLPESVFAITNSPVEGSGTLVAVFKPQNANLVFASPVSGAPGLPAFRALVVEDIPALPYLSISDGLLEGGNRVWIGPGYTYSVEEATYRIGGVSYESPTTTVTLSPSDPLFNRIDVFVVNTDGQVEVIEGTPSSEPLEPSINPATQLKLGIAIVEADTVEPTIYQRWIFRENAGTPSEFAAVSSSVRIVVNSATSPDTGTIAIEATLAQNGDYVNFTADGAVDMTGLELLSFKIKSKAAWGTSSIGLRFYNGGSPVGVSVVLSHGIFGFNSFDTSNYQVIAIPVSSFGLIGTPTALRATVNTSTTLGFFMDEIQLQEGTVSVIDNVYHKQGGDIRGATSVTGTRDAYDYMIVTTDTPRVIVKATGNVLIGTSTDNGSMLNVAGIIRGTTLRTTNYQITDDVANSEVDITISGSTSSTYSSAGSANYNFINGILRVSKSQATESSQLAQFLNTASNMGNFSIFAQLNNDNYSATVGTMRGYGLGTANYVTTGDIAASNNIYGVNINFSNQTAAENPNAIWISTITVSGSVYTVPWLVKKTGQMVWGQYGAGSFTSGTAVYVLGVTSTGQIIETTPGGGGGGSGTVTSVSGTSNRITITGTATVNPTVDIAATYVGQSSIVTLGTVTTGTWNATTIGPTYGGTGLTSYTAGDLIYSSATNTLAKRTIGSEGQVLTVSSGLPVWSTPSIAVSPVGTGVAVMYDSAGTLYHRRLKEYNLINIELDGGDDSVKIGLDYTGASEGYVIKYVSGAAVWAAGGGGGGSSTFIGLTDVPSSYTGNANKVLRVNVAENALEFATISGSGTVTSVGMSVPTFLSVSGSPITGSGTLAVTLSGTALPVANGGTGSTTQNFVDLSTTQTVAGAKTFSNAAVFSSTMRIDSSLHFSATNTSSNLWVGSATSLTTTTNSGFLLMLDASL